MSLPPLTIGDWSVPVPIIQGGMGIGVSLSSLAGAVARAGGIGVLSAAQPGWREPDFAKDPLGANLRALRREIARAKELAAGGRIGVNIMCAMRHYEDYVRCCVECGVDLIISGAGLPTNLPALTQGSPVKLAPIVSPPKSAKVLLKMWDRHYHTTADLVVIEGPMAGGHLGYSRQELESRPDTDAAVREILEIVAAYEEKYQKRIPVVFAGGVYDRADIDHWLSLGCAGVQMATRFVVTEECDASPAFKQAYLDAKREDIVIVQSPVGMPGRAIRNPFVRQREEGRQPVRRCTGCLEHCDPATTPYCITQALIHAVDGQTDEGLVFCGENAWRLEKMTTVPELFAELGV